MQKKISPVKGKNQDDLRKSNMKIQDKKTMDLRNTLKGFH